MVTPLTRGASRPQNFPVVTKKAQTFTSVPEVSFTCRLASRGNSRYCITVPSHTCHLLSKGMVYQVVLRPLTGTLR